jgi:S-adenosylmethionine:tRNA ribosyltransferase-isomerase
MNQSLDEFSYELPKEFIAQAPANPRESANLMLVNVGNKTIKHAHVGDFVEQLHPTDVLVINNTKVFKARLHGNTSTGSTVELFLVRPSTDNQWIALGKPGKKIHLNDTIHIADNFIATVAAKNQDGTLIVNFTENPAQVIEYANKYGEIPIPPYIKTIPTDGSYQTVYASQTGSVAAPTAGFHITDNLLEKIKEKGIEIVEITLHVGLGTFLPIKSDSLAEHTMHSEWVNVSDESAKHIMKAKEEGRRIVAIGTTTVRTLEGVSALYNGHLEAYTGDVNLFITPGFQFTIVDALLTNFHLPKSTLLVLVSALAGSDIIKRAYQEALAHTYRFYSFGDAMFIS